MNSSVKKNKKVIGKYKMETPKNIWIDEFVCLGSKMYAFNCGDDSKTDYLILRSNQRFLPLLPRKRGWNTQKHRK